jgi:hypothetical protein
MSVSIITKDQGLVVFFTVTEGVGVNLGEARDQGLRFSLSRFSRSERVRSEREKVKICIVFSPHGKISIDEEDRLLILW